MVIELIKPDVQEWFVKIGLFLFLTGVLSFIAFKPVDPATQALALEPLSFSHNLFICTFDDPAVRQSDPNLTSSALDFE